MTQQDALEGAVIAAQAEAQSAFGDGAVYLEKFVSPAKHVEMQMLCDNFGHVICLGERECSMQRKNQKVLEETPCAAISPELRQKMMRCAIDALVGHRLSRPWDDRNFSCRGICSNFMEMNTRLQVEHPVTEMRTGVDLVKWQIRAAAGCRWILRSRMCAFPAMPLNAGSARRTPGAFCPVLRHDQPFACARRALGAL